MTTIDILGIVRARIGRRHKISRTEMRDLLVAIASAGVDLRNEYAIDTMYDSQLQESYDPARAAKKWANMCRDITCISVGANLRDGHVRYDQPGSMHPAQHATLMFVARELGDYEYDQIGQMRRRADRLLVVDGPMIETPAPPAPPHPATRIRHRDLDGTWNRVLNDGTLQRLDVNDGQDPDPASKCRHQWRVVFETGELLYRRLPPESVGDVWRDIGAPEWEPRDPYNGDDLLAHYYEELAL